jgi:hypothetical protein
LHRLKKAKVLYVPSIFTPLEDTRMADGAGLKAKQLTQVQWEFMMTAWMQSRDFGEMRDRSRGYFKWGTKAFYYGRGRWVHGKQFKWPAMRFAGMPEETVSKHLYLNWDEENTTPIEQPRLIGKHRKQSLEELRTINDDQPFSIYGTTRVEDDEKHSPLAAVSRVAAGAPNGRSNGAAKPAQVDQPVAGD